MSEHSPEATAPRAAFVPSNKPHGYEAQRVDAFQPCVEAVDELALPPNRQDLVDSIVEALKAQISFGGDHPEVNAHLLAALRAAVDHQVTAEEAGPLKEAIAAFEAAEAERWEALREGTLAVPQVPLDVEIDDLVHEGYVHLDHHKIEKACDAWLKAWAKITELAAAPVSADTERTLFDLVEEHELELVDTEHWLFNLTERLFEASKSSPVYGTHLIQVCHDYLALFPDEPRTSKKAMVSALGKVLIHQGRAEEADAAFKDHLAEYPGQAHGYIAWAEGYTIRPPEERDYPRAEAILLSALDQPVLKGRLDVLVVLADLYKQWGKPDRLEAIQPMIATERMKHHAEALREELRQRNRRKRQSKGKKKRRK